MGALAAGCEVVEGGEMLFEQGCAQCELWTGKRAPREKIAAALLKNLFTQGSSHPAHSKMQPYTVQPVSLVEEAKGVGKRSFPEDKSAVMEEPANSLPRMI